LALDKALQPAERLVPLRRDRLQTPPRIREALLFKLPDALPSELLAAYEAGLLHHPQMLRDRLTRDCESFREPRDRHRAVVTEARDEAQPRLVTQRGEHRGGGDEVRGCSPRATSGRQGISRPVPSDAPTPARSPRTPWRGARAGCPRSPTR